VRQSRPQVRQSRPQIRQSRPQIRQLSLEAGREEYQPIEPQPKSWHRVLGFRIQSSGSRVQGSGFRVQGSGSRVRGSGFRVQGSEFRVQGLRCRDKSDPRHASACSCEQPRLSLYHTLAISLPHSLSRARALSRAHTRSFRLAEQRMAARALITRCRGAWLIRNTPPPRTL
jgi:hypothetical protein